MKELVVISGKGGTGKTSITASLAFLAKNAIIADCDVDAADLHLVLLPEVKEQHEFYSGNEAVIRQKDCIGCGSCFEHCRFQAIDVEDTKNDTKKFSVNPFLCEGCGVCLHFCQANAIDFPEKFCGEWMVSQTRCGPMVHAQLGIASENSGKLVSIVKREAKRIAEEKGHSLILVDGPPGIGCPVIASLTGASFILVVSEPTVSGEHDMERVLSLAQHFHIPVLFCMNKWDINPDMTKRIEDKACSAGARLVGRIRYDRSVTLAQMQKKTVVEMESYAAEDIRAMWNNLNL